MARTRALLRLTIRQHRFELFSMTAVLLVLAGVSVILSAIVRRELEACPDPNVVSPACSAGRDLAAWAFGSLSSIRFVAFFVSITAGIFVGVPLVANEVERSTAFLPWTLGRSRTRWLLERVVIVAVWMAIAAIVLGLVIDMAEEVLAPGPALGISLADYEVRGWLVPARVLVGVALGILAGAIFGRALPGLLLGVLLAALVLGGTAYIGGRLNASEAVIIDDAGALFLDQRFQDRTGALHTWDEAERIVPFGDPAFDETFTQVNIGIPGERSGEVIRREVGIHLLVALATVGLTVVVVGRRRPY